MSSAKIKIVVKDLNEFAESQVIKVKGCWSVKQLKKHLQKVLPNKPKARRQHLIYIGNLLRNSSRLREVLPTRGRNIVKIHLISTISTSANRKASKKLKRILWARHFGCQDASTSTQVDDTDENDEENSLYEIANREVSEMTELAESIARNPNDVMLKLVYQAYLDQIYYHVTLSGENYMTGINRPCVDDVFETLTETEDLEEYSDEEESINQDDVPQLQTQTQGPNETQPQNEAQEQPQNQAEPQPGQAEGVNPGEEEAPDFIDWMYLGFRIISVILFAYSNSTFARSMAALCIMVVVSIIPHLVVLELHRRAEFNLPRPEVPANAHWPTQLRAILNLFILSLIPDLI